VRHNTVEFEWDGDRYEWESALPVVGAGGNWNLWVLHEPDYRVDLFEQPAAPPGATGGKTFEQQTDDAMRRAKRTRTQADYGSADPAQTAPAKARRVRVAIGSADGVENLFPRQQR
jgi:hypothetical protein